MFHAQLCSVSVRDDGSSWLGFSTVPWVGLKPIRPEFCFATKVGFFQIGRIIKRFERTPVVVRYASALETSPKQALAMPNHLMRVRKAQMRFRRSDHSVRLFYLAPT